MNSQQLSSVGTSDGISPFGLQGGVGHPLGSAAPTTLGGASLGMTTDQNSINNSSISKVPGIGAGVGSPGGSLSSTMNNHQDLLSAQARERNRMIQVLQQQQQQQRQLSVATARGLPVFQSIAGHHDIRTPGAGTTAQRFMVDDFAGAGALLSRPEQEFLLARGYPNMATPGMSAFPTQADAMDFSHTNKLADFLFAKQAAAMSSAQLLPKVTRLPCQARGMKADHNGTTAFFEIPEDARHGQHLLCSHPSCRSAGVKFRYCLYCRKPVTKQNFRSRHLHADLDPNHNSKMGKLVRKRSNDDNNSCESGGSEDEPATKQPKVKDDEATQNRQGHWETLLEERPEGLDTMDVWIGRILSTSDPATLLPNGSVMETKDSEPSSRRIRWNDLLKHRPGPDASKKDVNKWLTQVLQISAASKEEQDETAEEQDDL